jgi:hypothetical protein
LYTSLASDIAIWEMVRRSAARNLSFLKNNVLTELHVDVRRVLDLSDPATVGRTREQLTGSDVRLCQDLAAAALERGFQAMLVPSAALPGSNLVLFPTHLPDPPNIHVMGSTALPLDIIARDQAAPEQE